MLSSTKSPSQPEPAASAPVPFFCGCCELPFARLQNGVLVIQSNHHGEKHQNVIAVAELVRLAEVGNLERVDNGA